MAIAIIAFKTEIINRQSLFGYRCQLRDWQRAFKKEHFCSLIGSLTSKMVVPNHLDCYSFWQFTIRVKGSFASLGLPKNHRERGSFGFQRIFILGLQREKIKRAPVWRSCSPNHPEVIALGVCFSPNHLQPP